VVSQAGGIVPLTNIYVRFSPDSANGTNSGFITHTSINAETKSISVTGIAIAIEPITQSSISFGVVTGTSIELNFIPGDGNRRILVARAGNAVNWYPQDGWFINGVNINFSLALDQGEGNKVVYDGNGNNIIVSGLSGNTTYYFAVYEYNLGTNNSQNYLVVSPGTASQTTLVAPTITVNPSSVAFGNVMVNTASIEKTYLISANTLSPSSGNIIIQAPIGFEVSLSSGSGFSTSIQLPYSGGMINQTTIYVRFIPTLVSYYSGNITNEGGNSLIQNVSVAGNGITSNELNEFQAEEGLLNRAEIRSEFPGFSGSGYVFLVNKAGAWLEVLFRREAASTDTITIHFSNGSGGARSLSVVVNEITLGNLAFPNTSSWSNWSTVKYVVPFQAGLNKLKLATIGTSTNPFIDKILIAGSIATPVYQLTLIPSGSGTLNSDPSEIYFDTGSNITLSAVPSGNFSFTRWFGSFESVENPYSLTIASHTEAVGIFMPSNAILPFRYEQNPNGFASINALGYSGTTGGANGITEIVSNGTELWNLMLDRQDPNNNKNLPPLTVYIAGILSPDAGIFGSSKMLDVKDAYDISIIGIGNDAIITGFGLKIFRAKNIIVRNIKFASFPDDGISIDANDDAQFGNHIWIDHCTFTDVPPLGYPSHSSYDGALDITHTAAYVTLSWNFFDGHDKNSLVGHSDSNVSDSAMKITYHHNWFKGTNQRNPRVRFAKVHVYNNYYSDNGIYGVSSNMEADVMVEGNYFLNVPIPTETSRDGSPQGDLVERNNIFINCGVPGTRGTAFEPSLFYSYTIDSTITIPDTVMLYAGSGKYDFSLVGEEPIPVEFLSFTGIVNGENVCLNWSTTTELNNIGFEILRKKIEMDMQEIPWQTIGFIQGKGTTTNEQFYSFNDIKPLPGNYKYMLKQLDFDGSMKFSDEIEIILGPITVFKLEQNYPNPFNPSTMIRYQVPQNSYVSIIVYDVLGNKIKELVNQEKTTGYYSTSFESFGLSSGLYICTMKAGNFTTSNKMILIK
jgi:pectate lyase